MDNKKPASIILAAGGSNRFGKPKQMLNWFGKTFVQQVIDIAASAGLDPIIVVTGANHEEVELSIQDRKTIIARNDHWEDGQSSSLIAGIKRLGYPNELPFVFLLCDQPQVSVEIINKIVHTAENTEYDIVTASVDGKRCPPILFKPECVADLLLLTGDQGGKGLMNKYRTAIVEVEDKRLILDIDTEEDYSKLIKLFQ